MKTMKRRIAALPWGYLIFAGLLSLAGVLLCAFPEESLANAIRVIGILTLLFFIVRLVLILGERERSVRFAFRVIGTLFALFCGGYMLIASEATLLYLFTILGLYLIMAGSFQLQTAITLRRYRIAAVWVMLSLAILSVAGGFLLLRFQPESLRASAILLGASLLVNAAANLLSLFVVPYIDSRRRSDAIDEYKEELRLASEEAEKKRASFAEKQKRKEEKAQQKADRRAAKKAKKTAAKAEPERPTEPESQDAPASGDSESPAPDAEEK